MAALIWDFKDISEMSPGDYLIGSMTGRHEGDEESQEKATFALLYGTFTQMGGLGQQEAADKVEELMERGVSVRWDGSTLGFDFGDPDDDADDDMFLVELGDIDENYSGE